jgi:hypothetical protein
MIRHGARSSTVSVWTGLSANRIRTLVKQEAFVPQAHDRGQRPPQFGYFLGTPLVATHAAALGSLFELLEVLDQPAVDTAAQNFITFVRAEKLCYAYEMYRAEVETPLIQFEHAALLAIALAEGKEISLQPCSQCGGAMLVDHSAPATDSCTHCQPSGRLTAIEDEAARAAAARVLPPRASTTPVDHTALGRHVTPFSPGTDESFPAEPADVLLIPDAAS